VPVVFTAHEVQLAPEQVQKVLPFVALFATKALLLELVETNGRFETFAAYPFAEPELQVGDPGHGGLDPDQTLFVTAEDDTDARIGTVTSDAMPAV
jgi:hypothetical protein